MLKSEDNYKEVFLGIDGGGSKCKAIVISENNQTLGTGISGPANPLHGFEQATNSITESAKLALADAGLSHLCLSDVVAGVGLAGVNLPVLFNEMKNWNNPFKHMYLATDLLIASLGAHDGSDGAVMITGTGSCGFSYIDGQEFIVGAHGFPHGDKGSGAWFGLQAVKQVLLAIDGVASPTKMQIDLLSKLDVKDDVSLVELIAGKPAAFYAQLANLVFDAAESGDDVAKNIVTEGAGYITNIAKTLWKKQPPRMSLIGGLTPRIKPWLDDDIKERLSAPLNPPEIGAVIFAKQKLALHAEETQSVKARKV